MRTINNIHSISADAQKSIKAFFYDFSKFMEENFSATPDQLMLDWNCVGATAQFHSRNNYFEFQLWECSEGYLDIPDMTAIVSVFSTTTEEMAAITGQWLGEAAKANGFRHLADTSAMPLNRADQIPGCASSCITL